MKKLILLGLSALIVLCVSAQNKNRTQLSGKITDSKSGAPIAGASIILTDSRVGTATDSAGMYLLTNIPGGHAVIEISSYGYKTLVEHIDLAGNTVHDVQLSPSMLVNEGVTVTAVAGAMSIRKTPIPITRMSKAELLMTPSTNIIDALTRQPGVSQVSTGPAVSKPVIRGLGYNRLVVINDGVRQEGQQWGDEHGIEIDENSVSRVEIVKGPASLIYGSDAMAGVINIITTNPVPANTIRANIISSYQTNNRQRSLFGSVGGNVLGFNWNAWGDLKAAADYTNRYDGRVYNSRFNEHNYGGYLGYNGHWGFSHFIVSSFNQKLGVVEGERDAEGFFVKHLPGGLEARPDENDFNSTQPDVPAQGIQHFKLTSDNSFNLGKGRLSLNLGWQRNQRKEFGNVDLPDEAELHFDLKTFNYRATYHFADHNGWNTSIGVNGMQQSNHNEGEEVLIPAYDLFDLGGFVYSSKTVGKATFSGGLRLDHRALQSKAYMEGNVPKFEAFEKNYQNVSGSIGVSYAVSDRTVWKFNIARGFRAPSMPELASNGAHEGTNRYEYGNRNLRSEKSWQADLGVELNSDHVMFNATAFYNRISNFIFYNKLEGAGGGDSLVYVSGDYIPAFAFNQRNATLYGGEVVIDIHPHPLDWLHWENSFSYVRGQFATAIEGTKNVPFIPAARWISELRGTFFKSGQSIRNFEMHLEADHTFRQGKAFTAFETETATPAYTLLNASVSADIRVRNRTAFTLYLMANNLADVGYQNHLNRLKYTDINPVTGRQGVFNMGRNFMVRVNVPINIK